MSCKNGQALGTTEETPFGMPSSSIGVPWAPLPPQLPAHPGMQLERLKGWLPVQAPGF